ncbi:hypothetical protein F8M41_002296 [Gigaspora margarita]|uniref:Uncharacterized protein n=1 Tax=Gigaspora margarita TaxID=4874 RepID=A0A8H4A7E8_GIGMA|nr:hypothetical protein F8M41_002296 [Gigaspora margarita]
MIELEKQIKSLLDIDADTESQPFTDEEVMKMSSAMLFIAIHRRRTYLKRLKNKSRLFITNGGYILLIGFVFMSAYIILLVMIATLE